MRVARMRRVSLPPRLRLCLVPSRYCSASPALHLDRTKFLAAIGARRELAVNWVLGARVNRISGPGAER
jgi:hypothetical protein